MSRLAAEVRFGGLTAYTDSVGDYSSTELGLSTLIKQYTGAGEDDKYASPILIGLTRPVETAGAIPALYPWAMQWSSTVDWIFCCDGAAAAATRRFQMFTFNRTTSVFSWNGSITCSIPFGGTQGTYVISGFRMTYDAYTTGTASASGTAVTGSSTTWQASRLAVGGRIGFGSTTPSSISTWYNITAIGSDTSITIDGSAGTVVDGPYVIEELRAVFVCTNATTATNGGLFVVKGLNPSAFTSGSLAVAAATNVDNIRATYWIKDASTVTNTAAFGADYLPRTSWTNQDCYVLNTLANPVLYKYNLRAALTVASGASTDAFVLVTGSGGAVTGTTSALNNGKIITAAHGNGSGNACMYFATTTRIVRTSTVTAIAAASTTWISDSATELSPGSASTYASSSTMRQVEYADDIDKLIIPTAVKVYATRYYTDGSQFDRIGFSNTLQINQSSADPTLAALPVPSANFTSFYAGGILYLISIGTTALLNFMYAVPLGADWEYAETTLHRLITPSIATVGCTAFKRTYINVMDRIGGGTDQNLGMQTEPYRMYYRTTGISDNSGIWNLIDYTGDITGATAGDEIQLMIEFRIIGPLCIPARIAGVCVTYEDTSTDSHYQPSVGNSSLVDKEFAWRFATAFGSTVPRLKVQLYNAVTGDLLVTDDSTTQDGTWEKSTDGGSNWVAWTNADKGNETTYLRFTPASLGDNIRVRARLSQY